ncbi:MAG TPA: hypothetical protein VFP77_12030 [Gemmatimonadaceae bacterium]|nr:hypothetical protein [Gemmatimonadaceae bacterium]
MSKHTLDTLSSAIDRITAGLPSGCVTVERRHFDIHDSWTEFQITPSREGATRIVVAVDDDETVIGISAGALVKFEVFVGKKFTPDVAIAVNIVEAIAAGGLVEDVFESDGKVYQSRALLRFPDGHVLKSWTHGAEFSLRRRDKTNREIAYLAWEPCGVSSSPRHEEGQS